MYFSAEIFSRESPEVLEKKFFSKKNMSNLFVQIRSSKRCVEIFKK